MLLRILLLASPGADGERIAGALPPEAGLVRRVDPGRLEAALARAPADLVLLRDADVALSPERVRSIRATPDHPDVIVLAGREDPERRAALLSAGCLAVVWERLPDGLLAETLGALVERRRRGESESGERGVLPFRLGDYASASSAMKHFLRLARRAATTDSTLLLLGETGVGKEWLARAIHAEGNRCQADFVAVSCAALPETLLESELFGHERGAFTGAARARRGYFELAHGGTLFLDEIGEVPLHLQAKLLRALEERRIRPLGSERSVAVDVRVMAATNRDLEAEVRAGRFREDLYYRLNVLALALPPLRERREDIPELVESYMDHFSRRLRREARAVDPEALEALVRHDWPGNVRELINTLERAVLLTEGPQIRVDDLPEAIAGRGRPPAQGGSELLPADWLERPWRELREQLLEAAEARYLAALLQRCEGRLWEVAQRAGIDPRSLFDKMRRHGLRKESFRPPQPLAGQRRRASRGSARPSA